MSAPGVPHVRASRWMDAVDAHGHRQRDGGLTVLFLHCLQPPGPPTPLSAVAVQVE